MRFRALSRTYFSAPNSLGARTRRGGVWSVIEMMASHSLRLTGNLVMVRLLLPDAFGLMAMVTTLLVGLTLVSDLGVHRSIVQSPNGTDTRFLRVSWVVQAIRGAVLAGLVLVVAILVWALAPLLAPPGTVYADPRLPGLIALAALSPLLTGLESTNQWLAGRQMAFGRITLVNLGSQVTGLAAMASLGLVYPTVWALLGGTLLGGASRVVLTHGAFAGPRMAVEWDRRIVDELWEVGRWVIGSSALTFLAGYADRLILAALLDTQVFGFYAIALIWVQAGQQLITKLMDPIGVAALSTVRRERPWDMNAIFCRFSRVIDGLCIAGFIATLVGGPFLIHLIYPPAYHAAAAFIPLLGTAVLASRFGALSMLIISHGQYSKMFAISAQRAVAICLSLPLAFMLFGLGGALLATALSPLAAAPLQIMQVRALLGEKRWVDLGWLAAILLVAAAAYAIYAPR